MSENRLLIGKPFAAPLAWPFGSEEDMIDGSVKVQIWKFRRCGSRSWLEDATSWWQESVAIASRIRQVRGEDLGVNGLGLGQHPELTRSES